MSSNLSGAQFQQLPMFMTPQEVGALKSSDFPGKDVKHSRGQMQRQAKRNWHTSEVAFGGPKPYLDHLTQSVNESEGIVSPIRVRHYQGGNGPSLQDGHHRAVVAMETNRLVPVQHDAPWDRPVSVQDQPVAKPKKQPYAYGKFS